MPDDSDGITMMRARMTRARRVPPPARKPAPAPAKVAEGAALPIAAASEPEPGPGESAAVAARPVTTARPSRRSPARRAPARPAVGPEDRVANLAIRVRQPLDDHLADAVHAFRREGVRTSKVELIEMLLWEMPADPADLRERLAAFREAAPRSAPLAG